MKTPHTIWLAGELQAVPKLLPAELFLTRLIEEFHQAQLPPRQIGGQHKDLAIPPTDWRLRIPLRFSAREIHKLKKAIYSGWRRALGETRYHYPSAEEMEKLIKLVIDEASAAGIAVLYSSGYYLWTRRSEAVAVPLSPRHEHPDLRLRRRDDGHFRRFSRFSHS